MSRELDKTGRVDHLVVGLIERYAQRNPLLKDVFDEFKADIEAEAARHLGPRTKHAREIKRLARVAGRVIGRQA